MKYMLCFINGNKLQHEICNSSFKLHKHNTQTIFDYQWRKCTLMIKTVECRGVGYQLINKTDFSIQCRQSIRKVYYRIHELD